VQVLPRFNCAPGDSCFCDTKGPLAKAVEDCIFVECPLIEDKLKAAKSQAEMCHRPVRNRAHVLAFISYIFFALSAVSMVLRVISRLPSAGGPGFGMDDWAIIACFPLAIALAVITAFEVRYGVGQDAWMLDSYTLEKFLMVRGIAIGTLNHRCINVQLCSGSSSRSPYTSSPPTPSSWPWCSCTCASGPRTTRKFASLARLLWHSS
jgi:hypothetical protein